jgi:hypothetical protein
MANPTPPSVPTVPFGEGFALQRYKSPLLKPFFSYTVKEILKNMFSSANKKKNGMVEIVTENNVSQTVTEQMIAFWDANANGFIDNGETSLFEYQITIIVSKDYTYLINAYESTSPASNEVVFFLEDNRGDLFSGSYAAIKVGANFQRNSSQLDIISQIETSNNYFHRYYTDGNNYKLDFSESQIQELIKTGKIERVGYQFSMTVMGVMKYYAEYSGYAYGFIAQGLDWIIAEIKKRFEFTDENWDPYCPTNAGKEPFIPYLFGPIARTKNWLFQEQEKTLNQMQANIKKELNTLKRQYSSSQSSYLNPSTPNFAINYTFEVYLKGLFQSIENSIDWLLDNVEYMMESMKYFDDKLLNVVNAYYCGLLNGLLGIVTGFIETISLAFKIMTASANLASDAEAIQQKILELLDEMIQITNLQKIIDVISTCFERLVENCMKINFWAFTASISIEKVAYFFGNALGFIVQILVDEFISGGSKGVVDILEAFGDLGVGLKNFVLSKMQSITATAKNIFEVILKIIQRFMEMLKRGPEEFLKLIDEFFETIKTTAKLAAVTLDAIKFNLKIKTTELEILQKNGLDFVKMVGEGKEMVYSICKIAD